MIIRRPRYSLVKRAVAALLKERSIVCAPVPVETVAAESGIKILYGDLGETSGLLARRPRETLIGVNSTQATTRQRFTIAHEFGHFVLHEGLDSHSDKDFKVRFRNSVSSEASDAIEIEANFFAANLLMPEQFLADDDAELAIDDDEAVKRLAIRYKVSRHAMSLRLSNVYGHLRPF